MIRVYATVPLKAPRLRHRCTLSAVEKNTEIQKIVSYNFAASPQTLSLALPRAFSHFKCDDIKNNRKQQHMLTVHITALGNFCYWL